MMGKQEKKEWKKESNIVLLCISFKRHIPAKIFRKKRAPINKDEVNIDLILKFFTFIFIFVLQS